MMITLKTFATVAELLVCMMAGTWWYQCLMLFHDWEKDRKITHHHFFQSFSNTAPLSTFKSYFIDLHENNTTKYLSLGVLLCKQIEINYEDDGDDLVRKKGRGQGVFLVKSYR